MKKFVTLTRPLITNSPLTLICVCRACGVACVSARVCLLQILPLTFDHGRTRSAVEDEGQTSGQDQDGRQGSSARFEGMEQITGEGVESLVLAVQTRPSPPARSRAVPPERDERARAPWTREQVM